MAATLGFPEQDSLSPTPWRDAPPRALLPWLLASAAGLILLSVALLWNLWMGDALRSIGIYFPLVSLLLTGRVWRRLGWESRGTWWGLLPLLYAAFTARAAGNTALAFAFSPRFHIPLLPVGLTIFAYASGVVLLLGGTRVWRKAAFPLALLLFVNPVPKAFALLDLPLQYASAYVARSAAAALRVQLSGDQLRLMFSPDFGMFIAPGCNGIRGAVTLAYLALIGGYIYRFTRAWRVISVLGGVALGYVFNLVRLCVLVLFYWVALRFPSLQPHGEGADYAIGASLFLTAAVLLGSLIRWKKREAPPEENVVALPVVASQGWSSMYWKGAVLTCTLVLVIFPYRERLWAVATGAGGAPDGSPASSALPAEIGQHRLQRTWLERDSQNQITYRWGAYSVPGEPESEIDLALWFGAYVHYPMACHLYRGDRPAWEEVSVLPTGDGGAARFMVDLYQDPAGAALEAATVCGAGGCTERVSMPAQTGLIFTSTGMKNYLFRPADKPVPVLVRVQAGNSGESLEAARVRMMTQLRDFVSALDSRRLTRIAQSGS